MPEPGPCTSPAAEAIRGAPCQLRARWLVGLCRPHPPDLLVDVRGDGVVTAVHQVLIESRGPHRGVPHPLHQLTRRGTAGRGESVPGVAQIVEVHIPSPVVFRARSHTRRKLFRGEADRPAPR